MNVVELRSELEGEASWRDGELRELRNSLTERGLGPTDALYCRTILVMTYAHLEGFVKQSLAIYVGMINNEAIPCGDLAESLAASTLAADIRAVQSRMVELPGNALDLERKLQRQAEREVALIRRVRESGTSIAVLDVDLLTSTDSNLNPAVLRRNLYRLGLDPESMSEYHSDLSFLVRTRNDVAHGKRTANIDPKQFESAVAASRQVMNRLPRVLYAACKWGKFKRLAAVI